ncbi:cell division protein ZapC [Parashewanella spongiae]|uniref:Cell division protein ZapC n=1 Tax=Parashewanella spongiae TaxID=342950 RepID=A0A3A6UC49_9GAMM|nr:cell division protein ZapC [Parashewanella spongiae]MCL1078493.1 cell division protein ZapC [Parashewanella spongiae]RJY14676.1 cell division protein ZapC [Parashewanella spongiae]
MLLMPKKDWQWQYDYVNDVLSLSLGSELEFLTSYKKKQLIPDACSKMVFDLEHANFYIEMIDRLQNVLTITEAGLVQIALNATAAHFMLKPQMPKSWFFEASNTCVYSEHGKVFELKLEHNNERVLVLAIERGLQATLVMILSPESVLSSGKVLRQFDTIKVMHDRLRPLKSKRQIAAA